MPTYTPPLRDLKFVLHELLDVTSTLKTLPPHADIDADTINAVLEEGGKFAAEVIFPLNASGDAQGCRHDKASHEVRTPEGFRAAYAQYVEGGWPALSADPAYGGQGLPIVLNQCFYEMLNSANQAWTMYPGLSHGAYECLHAHGTPQQKATYLPKLTSGEWTGTMCLTEPHCGTDLGMLRTKAEPVAGAPEGTYRLTGQKIFISAGEHDLAPNIVHLVLARLPDAPAGSKGISLFVVPKFHVKEDGSLGERNAIFCNAIEHKMGIHGSATCQIVLEGAVGTLVGAPHKGLAAMFVMMNAARLGVGNQSLGLTEVAYQNAVAYARDRLQMRSLSGPKAPDKPADPIIVHPDVRKMLLTARAYAEGGRALAVWCALLIDRELSSDDAEERAECADLVAVLTPVIKAFMTDNAWIATSHCLQVYGGHGYVREWGMEQYVRDSRINLIYEGTNTIQALDLLGRKVVMDGGAGLKLLATRVNATIERAGHDAALAVQATELAAALQKLGAATKSAWATGVPAEALANATPYLQAFGHVVLAWVWLDVALAARRAGDTAFAQGKLAALRYYFAYELPRIDAWLKVVAEREAVCRTMDDAWF